MKVLTNEELSHILLGMIILIAVYHFIVIYLLAETKRLSNRIERDESYNDIKLDLLKSEILSKQIQDYTSGLKLSISGSFTQNNTDDSTENSD